MSISAIGAEILGGGGIHPPPWYTSLKHPMALGVKWRKNEIFVFDQIIDKDSIDILISISKSKMMIIFIWKQELDPF